MEETEINTPPCKAWSCVSTLEESDVVGWGWGGMWRKIGLGEGVI